MKFWLGFFMGLLNTIMLFIGGIIGAIVYDKLLIAIKETRTKLYPQKPKPTTYNPKAYEWTKQWAWNGDDEREKENS